MICSRFKITSHNTKLYKLNAVMGTDINISIGSLVTWSESKVDLWLQDKEDPEARAVVPFVLYSD